eukprot:6749109-Pyramimonas_sp.AAC.1
MLNSLDGRNGRRPGVLHSELEPGSEQESDEDEAEDEEEEHADAACDERAEAKVGVDANFVVRRLDRGVAFECEVDLDAATVLSFEYVGMWLAGTACRCTPASSLVNTSTVLSALPSPQNVRTGEELPYWAASARGPYIALSIPNLASP